MTKKTASGVAAKKYDATNCIGATVFDVDGDVFLKCVKSIDILAGEVELFYEPYRVYNPTYTIKFNRIESIFGDAETPMRFNCYARSGAGGQVAQASSGAAVQEIRAEREKLEAAVLELFNQFKARTQMCVVGCDVQAVEVHHIGQANRETHIKWVSIKTEDV